MSHYGAQAGLKLAILLPQVFEYWGCRLCHHTMLTFHLWGATLVGFCCHPSFLLYCSLFLSFLLSSLPLFIHLWAFLFLEETFRTKIFAWDTALVGRGLAQLSEGTGWFLAPPKVRWWRHTGLWFSTSRGGSWRSRASGSCQASARSMGASLDPVSKHQMKTHQG